MQCSLLRRPCSLLLLVNDADLQLSTVHRALGMLVVVTLVILITISSSWTTEIDSLSSHAIPFLLSILFSSGMSIVTADHPQIPSSVSLWMKFPKTWVTYNSWLSLDNFDGCCCWMPGRMGKRDGWASKWKPWSLSRGISDVLEQGTGTSYGWYWCAAGMSMSMKEEIYVCMYSLRRCNAMYVHLRIPPLAMLLQ